MVKVTDKQFGMDGYLANNLEPLRDSVKKDWDVVICIDGGEGMGKSVLAQQVAYFLDPTFTVERMTIGLKEFEEAIQKAKPHTAVVGDEMMRLLNSRSAMTNVNKRIVELLAECRQKNLYIILVMPSFFDMDKYGALWRTTALIHVYTGNEMKRGFFSFFDYDKKKRLYLHPQGKKYYNYKCVKPNFIGRFSNVYVIDEVGYRKKKADSLKRDKEDDKDSPTARDNKERLAKLIIYLHDKIKMTYAQIGNLIDVSGDTCQKKAYRLRKTPENGVYDVSGGDSSNKPLGSSLPRIQGALEQ
jgi:hypothetical protein